MSVYDTDPFSAYILSNMIQVNNVSDLEPEPVMIGCWDNQSTESPAMIDYQINRNRFSRSEVGESNHSIFNSDKEAEETLRNTVVPVVASAKIIDETIEISSVNLS